MQKRSFFGQQGLTSTSANHYANLAKELVRKTKAWLESLRWYSTNMTIIGSTESTIVSNGNTYADFESIKTGLKAVAQLNSLIAFFREAIKEKEELAKQAQSYTDQAARDALQAEYDKLKKPVRAEYLTEEQAVQSWSIGQQEKYLSLEAEAAVLGKYIHEDGALSRSRIELLDKTNNPIKVNESGRDTLIYKYTPTVEQSVLDKLYFELQAQHRKVQAELNGMKKAIEDQLVEQHTKVDNEYRKALQEYNNARSILDDKLKLIVEDENMKRTDLAKEVQALKIVVPDRLKEIFEAVKEQ